MRDVAQQMLRVLDRINGLLIPVHCRLAWMKGYGVIQAYLHDIGMVDLSHFGRTMHPEYAAQAVFCPEFDQIVQTVWAENCGNLAWRLPQLWCARPAATPRPARTARPVARSQQQSAGQALNDRARLRAVMQTSVGVDLDSLYQRKQAEANRQKLSQAQQAGQSQALIEPLVQALRAAESDLTSPQAAARQTHYQNEVLRRHYDDFARCVYLAGHSPCCCL